MTDKIQAIIRQSFTITATFTGAPTPEQRAALKAAGAEFKNGAWVRNQAKTDLVDVPEALAAFTV